jgi:hypothetical protein
VLDPYNINSQTGEPIPDEWVLLLYLLNDGWKK